MTAGAKWAWWKKGLRFLIFAFVIALTLLVLAASWISWQGRREWSETKKDLLARGEKLSLIEQAPPPVPDAENFFADPMWMEELQWGWVTLPDGSKSYESVVPENKKQLHVLSEAPSEEEVAGLKRRFPRYGRIWFEGSSRLRIVNDAEGMISPAGDEQGKEWAAFSLAMLEPCASLMNRVETLLQRPKANFAVEYDSGFSASLPQIRPMQGLAQAFALRARAELRLGQNQDAFRDTLAILRLSRTVEAEPMMTPYDLRLSMLSNVTTLIEIGIASHSWTDEELAAFEQELQGADLVSSLANILRGERGAANQLMESYRKEKEPMSGMFWMLTGKPMEREKAGWWQQFFLKKFAAFYLAVLEPGDQSFFNQFFQREIEEISQANFPGLSNEGDQKFRKIQDQPQTKYTHLFSRLIIPLYVGAIRRTAFMQDQIVQARLACALEQYYLAHKEYPLSLDALAPEYFASLPVDVVTLKPMHYERTATNQFRLWSLGWDGKDDNGRPVPHRDNARFEVYVEDGDWIWGQTKWTW